MSRLPQFSVKVVWALPRYFAVYRVSEIPRLDPKWAVKIAACTQQSKLVVKVVFHR